MSEPHEQDASRPPQPGIDDVVRTDETGDVDLSLLEYNLSLTVAERIERHYQARLLAERMLEIARQRYGSLIDDLEEAGEIFFVQVPPSQRTDRKP